MDYKAGFVRKEGLIKDDEALLEVIDKSWQLPKCFEANQERWTLCVGRNINCRKCMLYEGYGRQIQ